MPDDSAGSLVREGRRVAANVFTYHACTYVFFR